MHDPSRELPQPDPDARRHSEAVREHIATLIRAAEGWIPFSEYMQQALYAAGLGYYAAGAHKFGEAGDFITAPELSPLFSRCLALQCAQVLEHVDGGDILEFGAGSGRMAADILEELARRDALPARYLILEPSPELARRQRILLDQRDPGLAARVEWLDGLPEQPIEGIVLANEVLDAMPVERFRITDDGPQRLGVALSGEEFVWSTRPDATVAARVERLRESLDHDLPVGYESELPLAYPAWLADVAACLGEGALLCVDYGLPRHEYYAAERSGGTLMCHYRHRAHADPFFLPGLCDITAWVDFTALAEAGLDAGMALAGYATQAHMLISLGLDQFVLQAQSDFPADTEEQVRISQQVRQLTLPDEMGERFKAMAFTRNLDAELMAFSFRDLRDGL